MKLRLLEKVRGLSWDKHSVAVIVALCQLGISNGSLMFHSFMEFNVPFSLTKNSNHFFVRRSISCNSAFFSFVQLELGGKKYKLCIFCRNPLDSIFHTLL